jgi:hypothetical protein
MKVSKKNVHDDSEESTNRGIFIELLKWLAEGNTARK